MSTGVPIAAFLIQSALVSLSGVMAPGPMTAATIGEGNRSPHAGVLIAIGHGIIEIPLMILIFFGAGRFLIHPGIKAITGFAGGIFLLLMCAGMFRTLKKADLYHGKVSGTPLVSGIILSAANPYFIIWWATVGAALIINSSDYGYSGFILFMMVHWICDFLWYYFLSAVSSRGKKVFGDIFQRSVYLICGILLGIFSFKFILDSLPFMY